MTDTSFDPFPDVHDQPLPYPEGEVPDPRNQATRDANALHDRVYEAVMYILTNDFQFLEDGTPPARADFPGTLSQDELALFLAVYGVLLADDWDPTAGKTAPSSDDTAIPETQHFVVRRFVDATVAAVQEYTSNAQLFRQVFTLLSGPSYGTAQTSASAH